MFYFILFVSAVVVNYSLTQMDSFFLKSEYRWNKRVGWLIDVVSVAGCFLIMQAVRYHTWWLYVMLVYAIIINACKFRLEQPSKRLMLIYIAVIYFAIYIISFLCVDAFVEYEKNAYIYQSYIGSIFLLSSLLEFFLACVVGKICEIDIRRKYDKLLVAVSVVLPLLSVYMIAMIYNTNISLGKFVVIAVIMVVINVGLLLLLYSIIGNYDREINSRLLVEQNRFYEQQMQLMKESYENVRSVKHDLNNSLATIKDLVEAGKTEDVITFINETDRELGSYKALIDTGNTALDGMLNYKLQDAKMRNIQYDYKLTIPEGIQINSFDLSAIVGNLLDNAIRETLKTECPKIWVSVEYFKESIMIIVKNTFIKKQQLETCEDEKGMDLTNIHGVGLKNVEKIVRKYQGELMIEQKDGMFIVNVICFMKMR